jgi:hypothetical protein
MPRHLVLVAQQIVLQVAFRDIGQLTDLSTPAPDCPSPACDGPLTRTHGACRA